MSPIRVLLVEDNEVYRSSLELLLGLQPGIEVVGTVASGSDAARAAAELAPAVVLMDYRLPRPGRRAAGGAAIVCLTAEATAEERAAILDAGAGAVVEKGGPVERLADAIRAAAGGSATDPATH